MATPILYDRVLETTTTTGTGTLTLGGAVAGFQSWAAIGNVLTSYYYIEGVDANGVPTGEWEVGLGTYTVSGTTLARTTVLKSSNSNNAVSLSAGTKRVGNTIPAAILNLLFNPPAVRANRTSGQTIANVTIVYLQLNAADDFDTDTMHDTVTNNTRVTFTTPGVYLITGEITYNNDSASGSRYALLDANVGALRLGTQNLSALDTVQVQVTALYKAAAGDYVQLGAYQSSGGNVTANAAVLSAVRVAVG